MIETRWWWIRHAPVTSNRGRIYGASDVPCDTSDRLALQRLAAIIPGHAVWVTSHLQRTQQTADAILKEMPGDLAPERLTEAELAEQNFGDWQGLTHDELAKRRDGAWHRFWLAPAHERPPGGESFEEMATRVAAAIRRLNDRHFGRDIVSVTHGGTIRAALALALELPAERALAFEVANCSLTRLDYLPGSVGSHALGGEGSWRVGQVNYRP